uniref:Tc1-like transposase DDE domain-containing protein n=1 Tax=Trichogramma kaykai TaxID=54128 RepID=A0ABD2WEH9_9HYME
MWMYKGQDPIWIDERNNYPDFKIMVFAGVVHDSIVGPYFFEGNLNSRMYAEFLRRVFFPELQRVAPNVYFQQDGAPPHFAARVRRLLNHHFPNRWIGRGGPIPWPGTSPDLTICDYGLWGDIKARVKKMDNINKEALIANITEVRRNYPRANLRRAQEQLELRFRKCIEHQGGNCQAFLRQGRNRQR